jgi:hypothetical protein
MPLLSPVFREINYQRIRQLDADGFQPATIARIVNDETRGKEKILAPDIRGYLKLQKMGSERMLVSQKSMNGINGLPHDPKPT